MGDVRFRFPVGLVKEFWYGYSCPCTAQYLGGRNKGCFRKILAFESYKLQASLIPICGFFSLFFQNRLLWGYGPP